jgi:hypothetical protein
MHKERLFYETGDKIDIVLELQESTFLILHAKLLSTHHFP